MRRGSITPFCAISMMLVASFLFALLESARVYGLNRYVALKTESGMDSVCAEYQPFLWREYGLLFLDGAYGTEHFSMDYVSESLKTQVEKGIDKKGDLFALKLNSVSVDGFMMATDAKGEVFLYYVAERMKEHFPLGIAEDLYEQFTYGNNVKEQYGGAQEAVLEAKQLLEEIKGENEEAGQTETTLSTVIEMQRSNILRFVLGETDGISLKSCYMQDKLKTREKVNGTMQIISETDWYQKLLVLAYMDEYFSNYREQKEGHYLNYEMEYVVSGKNSDWENLSAALERILLIREAANVCYLLQDKEKMQIAEFLANLLGLLVEGNPVAVEVFQAGIVGAWAYLESVLDVRALVAGEVIPLIKKEHEWTTDVGNILASFRESAKAKKCETGLSYEDYLKQLLFFTNEEELAYRMMEVMEFSMKQQEDYQNCRMNQMLVAIKYQLKFESNPVFFSMVTTGNVYNGAFYFEKEAMRSYIP